MQLVRHCVGKENRKSGTWLEEVFVLNTVDMRAVSSYVNENNSLEKEMVRKRDSPSCKALDQASFGL